MARTPTGDASDQPKHLRDTVIRANRRHRRRRVRAIRRRAHHE